MKGYGARTRLRKARRCGNGSGGGAYLSADSGRVSGLNLAAHLAHATRPFLHIQERGGTVVREMSNVIRAL